MPIGSTSKTKFEERAIAIWLLDPDTGLPTGSLAGVAGVSSKGFRVKLPDWHYLEGGAVTLDGASPIHIVVPAGATIFELDANGGEVYYEINGITADALSPGYIADGSGRTWGPLDNLVDLWVFSATADTKCHYQFAREA